MQTQTEITLKKILMDYENVAPMEHIEKIIFRTRRLTAYREKFFEYRKLSRLSKFSEERGEIQEKNFSLPKEQKKERVYLRKNFSTAVLAGLAFALSISVGTEFLDASLLKAATTDIHLIPQNDSTLTHAFQTGDFDFEDILKFGLHIIKLGGIIGGIVYLIMNVWAGIQYVVGSTMDDKDTGKNILLNSLLGFALIVFSWIGVDLVISFLTTS